MATGAGQAGAGSLQASSRRLPRVALLIETSTLFGRRLLHGIAQYLRENQRWSIYLTDRAVNEVTPHWIASWEGDGIISRVPSPGIREILSKRRIPTVDLNEQLGALGVPMISNDHAAIGRMAAKHLLDRGFQQFAFLGHDGYRWSDRRRAAFVERVERANHACTIYGSGRKDMQPLREAAWEGAMDQIAEWVRSLPKPSGIMASDDFRALQLLSACRLADVAVPEQVAVIGVGADDVVCELSDPPLSSVVLNAWRMGYEAARLLDRLMRGEPPTCSELLIGPLDVARRLSTDTTAISDPVVAQSVRFIREHACDGINVETVVHHAQISRTSLQGHFRRALNQSIHDTLIGARIARIKELLAETSLSVEMIAEKCGFQHPEYMSSMLKQRTGWTPAGYRRQHGTKAPRS